MTVALPLNFMVLQLKGLPPTPSPVPLSVVLFFLGCRCGCAQFSSGRVGGVFKICLRIMLHLEFIANSSQKAPPHALPVYCTRADMIVCSKLVPVIGPSHMSSESSPHRQRALCGMWDRH